MPTDPRGFPHQRLDVYHESLRLTVGVERLCERFPRGHAELRDQLRRSAAATTRNIAEGANRWSPKDKASRFTIALGEAGECEAALEMAQEFELGAKKDIRELRELANRVGAMLTVLVKRQRGMAD